MNHTKLYWTVIFFISSLAYGYQQDVLFNEKIFSKQLQLIDSELKSIRVLMYTATDPVITEALIRAHERGVHVECVFDENTLTMDCGKAFLLRSKGIKVSQYVSNHKHGIMHRKTFIFGSNYASLQENPDYNLIFPRSVVMSGCCNMTPTAYNYSEEDAATFEDPNIVTKYENNFREVQSKSLEISAALASRHLALVGTLALRRQAVAKVARHYLASPSAAKVVSRAKAHVADVIKSTQRKSAGCKGRK